MALAPDPNGSIDYLFAWARAGGLDVAPLAGRCDLDQGLVLRLRVLERWRATGEQRGGWKVGFTSAAQWGIPVGEPANPEALSSGLAIERGDRVIVGAWARCAIETPGRWTTEFAGIGSVSVEFT